MKRTLSKWTFLMAVWAIALNGCETPTASQEEVSQPTNFELIKENLDIYLEQQATSRGLASTVYACSEQGNYTSSNYVNHQLYLNEFYIPDGFSQPNPEGNRFASWMTNLQDWLSYVFNDINPGGSNSQSVYIDFDVYGANGGVTLSPTDGNRAYNEFVCRLMDELNVNSVNQLDNYTFSLTVTVDYFLCCNGSSCCEPRLMAYGTAYSN